MSAVTMGASFVAPVLAADTKKKLKVKETDSLDIKFVELNESSGPYPNEDDFVTMVYAAYHNNGIVYDDTNVKGRKAISYRLGQKQYIQGIEGVLSPCGREESELARSLQHWSMGQRV